MKILCRHEQMASHYIYQGLGLAFQNLGHEFRFWNPEQNSAFDIFNDTEYQPDVFIGQGYNLTRAEIKCINSRPNLKCLMKVGMWGEIDDVFDHDKYDALFTSSQEKVDIDALQNKDRLFLFNFQTPSYRDYVIGRWKDTCPNLYDFYPVADIHSFYPEPNDALKTDLSFIGGYWEYKSKNLNKYIIPLCSPVGKYKIKIFGNQGWPVPQFMGFADDNLTRQIISSSKIYPCVHEPQSNEYGYEILSRVFNGIACKTFVISDYVEAIHKDIFKNNELLTFDNPKEYIEAIDYYLEDEEERNKLTDKLYDYVINNYTYEHHVNRLIKLFK